MHSISLSAICAPAVLAYVCVYVPARIEYSADNVKKLISTDKNFARGSLIVSKTARLLSKFDIIFPLRASGPILSCRPCIYALQIKLSEFRCSYRN